MFSLLETFCRAHGLGDDDMFNVRLVLDEAVINIIVHGYEDTADHFIHVSVRVDDRLVSIHIDDDGVPYNPLDAPPPRFDLPIEERRIGGLGVHIMKTLARDVKYRRDGDRNHLDIAVGIGQENGTADSA